MVRLALLLIGVLIAVLFATNNMHNVQVGLVVGRPVHVRLFFLLLTVFLAGALISTILHLYLNAESRKKKTATPEPVPEAAGDEYFSS